MPVAFLSSAMRAPNCRNSSMASAELGADRDVQPLDLLVVEPVGRRERREAGGVQDLVRVGAPDARDRALVAQQACAAARRAAARPSAPRRRTTARGARGRGPASSASSASCVYRPTRTWRRVARSETTSSEPSSNGTLSTGRCRGASRPARRTRAAVRHEVHDERRPVVGLEEHPLRTPARRARSGVRRGPRRADRGSSRPRSARTRARRSGRERRVDRAPARAPPTRAAPASGGQYRGNCRTLVGPTCNGAPSRRAQIY